MHINVQEGMQEVEVSVCFSCNFTTRKQVMKEKKEEKVWGHHWPVVCKYPCTNVCWGWVAK